MKTDRTREEYIDSKELAELLRFKSPRYAREVLVRAGIKPVNIGWKKKLFRRKDVDHFFRERGA